jgi:site-specific recombinase XerD
MVHTRLLASRKPPASCLSCSAWGLLPGRYCAACSSFAQNHPTGVCAGCDRGVPLKKDYCRLCWCQASLQARGEVTVLGPYLARVRDHQLFFAWMHKPRQPGPPLGKHGRRSARPRPTPALPRSPITGWVQPRLFDMPRDFTRFDRRQHAELDNPWLAWARHTAHTLGEARGWTRWVASDVDRALVILLSHHVEGETIRYSELFPALRARGLSVERTVEVLTELELFDDDRVPAFERWLDRKLIDLAQGIRRDTEAWLRLLREGGPRNRPHDLNTVWAYLNEIQPLLLKWSTRHDHLREVTREDILTSTNSLHGNKRHHTLSVLRSLFRHCKKTGTIFRDPTARIRVGRQDYAVVQPLQPAEVRAALAAAATPSARLALALAAIHAARPKAIRELLLDDIDLGNHRLIIAGHARPLDEYTRQAILDWLDYRRSRWPNTANPHLILSQQSALETGPVSKVWITNALRGLTATLERLRVDRQLKEALTHGPDPLHLATVFGINEKTAIRYATTARQLLQTPLECDTPY